MEGAVSRDFTAPCFHQNKKFRGTVVKMALFGDYLAVSWTALCRQ